MHTQVHKVPPAASRGPCMLWPPVGYGCILVPVQFSRTRRRSHQAAQVDNLQVFEPVAPQGADAAAKAGAEAAASKLAKAEGAKVSLACQAVCPHVTLRDLGGSQAWISIASSCCPLMLQAEITAELLAREVARRRNFAIISHPDAGERRVPHTPLPLSRLRCPQTVGYRACPTGHACLQCGCAVRMCMHG
jgi:hypothetical protein